MKWYKALFVGERAAGKTDKIKERFLQGRKYRNVFFITLPANSENMLDIIPYNLGMIMTWRELSVIGVAVTRQEAVLLTEHILQKVYDETKDVRVREYFAPEELWQT